MCANHLKRTCRRLGLERWPYRKLASLEGMRASIEADVSMPDVQKQARVCDRACMLARLPHAATCMHVELKTSMSVSLRSLQILLQRIQTDVARVMDNPNEKVCMRVASRCSVAPPLRG
jgi:RWP-RK domain